MGSRGDKEDTGVGEKETLGLEALTGLKRTHYCGVLRREDSGREVVLTGWVDARRDHGGVIFVDLRDREGIVQVVFNPEFDEQTHRKARQLRSEHVIAVRGKVRPRPEGTANPNLPTGEVEVMTHELRLLNTSDALPFSLSEGKDVAEEVRLRYRYLDLRRPQLQANLMLRHRAVLAIRNYFHGQGFVEIETPFLTKSTPEGARDYLVPSRVNPGRFYALPQSPQIFKQLLMVAGYDRYFQIVKCFRDEDLRADRQPEFTQIDVEMSFIEKDDLFEVMEGLMQEIFRATVGVEIAVPFPRLAYDEAMALYGVDKPDTRFGLEIRDLSSCVAQDGFPPFRAALDVGGVIKGINAEGLGQLSRRELDELGSRMMDYGPKGLFWIKCTEEGYQSPLTKSLDNNSLSSIGTMLAGKPGDLLLISADKPEVVASGLGNLRLYLAERFNLIPRGKYNFLWVTDFPLLEYSEEEKRYVSMHHPFTSPQDEDLHLLESRPERVKAKSYDLVLNGSEIAGGSIRIHRRDVQRQVFDVLGIGPDEAQRKFGFLIEALGFGAPPHGGIAFGLDRIVMILAQANSIRDVIAFPKTNKAVDLMSDAPSEVSLQQLRELCLRLEIAGK